MRFIGHFIALSFLFVLLGSCSKDESQGTKPKSTSINKILPLGASRVEGSVPEYQSFRYALWKDLIEGNWTFDFIGTQTDPFDYPTFRDGSFDPDHEGRAGWTSGQILEELNTWLEETGSPDIVLFSSPGGNDALEGLPYNKAVKNIREIIELLQRNNPDVTILIEQMAPARSDMMMGDLQRYFNQLQQEVRDIATNKSTLKSPIIAVDMHTGFTDNLLADDVHYNEAGAEFIADKYYKALESVLQD